MKPQAWYWRKALRDAQTREEVLAYAMTLVEWLERDKAAFRALGMVPPKHGWAPGEYAEKVGAGESAGHDRGEHHDAAEDDASRAKGERHDQA